MLLLWFWFGFKLVNTLLLGECLFGIGWLLCNVILFMLGVMSMCVRFLFILFFARG